MCGYRHCAINIKTGTIISCPSGNQLKRVLATDRRLNRKHHIIGENTWRFCHDFGRKWEENGLPRR